MYMTGFADEASGNIDVQIAVTKELGWKYIESRSLYGGKNIASISDAEFEELHGKLQDAGVSVNCYGSGIANWAKPINQPPESSYEELKNAIPRLQKLGTKLVRIMSFSVPMELRCDGGWALEEEVIRRVTHLVKMAEDAGLLLVHENCNNWGGLSYEHTLRLMDRIQSPALKLVFDTGNPCFNIDYRGDAPFTKRQSAWEFYKNVREFIAYVHIKDGYVNEDGKNVYTFANEGNGEVKRVFADLAANGYDGGFSIEPHMGAVFHDGSVSNPEKFCCENYVEYGRRCEAMLTEVYGRKPE